MLYKKERRKNKDKNEKVYKFSINAPNSILPIKQPSTWINNNTMRRRQKSLGMLILFLVL